MKTAGIGQDRRIPGKAVRVLPAVLVFAIVLALLYMIRPIKATSFSTGQTGVAELDHYETLEQDFFAGERLSDVWFRIATYKTVIENGSLRVRVTDSASGSIVYEKLIPAEELKDNDTLTIHTDLLPGEYTIAFTPIDFSEEERIGLYRSTMYDLPYSKTGVEIHNFAVSLGFAEAESEQGTTENKDGTVFRLSSWLTVAVIFGSILITMLRRRKQTELNARAAVKPAIALEALVIAVILMNLAVADSVRSGGTQFLRDNRALFYLVLILLAVFMYMLAEDYPFSVYLLLFCVGLTLIFADTAFSVIDEGAHTEVTQYVIRYRRFPTVEYNYEAVQGPVYYYVLALLSGWLPMRYTYFAGRIFGLVCLVLFGWITGKTVRTISEVKGFRVPKALLNICMIIFVMNPHILIRFTRVSNEALMSVLAAAAIFESVQMLLNKFDVRRITLCTVLCAIAFLTKSTAVFIFGLIFLVCAYHHKWKVFFLQVGLYLLLIAPWFIQNYRIYGHLTAMQEHLDYVLPIVNPELNVPDIWKSILYFFERYFMSWECSAWYDYPMLDGFLYPLCLLLLGAALLLSLGWLISFIRNRLRFTYDLRERKKVLFLSFTALPAASMIMHSIQSLMTLNNSIRENRYVLMLNGVFCCLLLFGLSRFSGKAKKGFTVLLCVFYAFFCLSLICGYTEKLIV